MFVHVQQENKVMDILDGIGRMFYMWVNPNAHCASCAPTTGYVGKGKRGELRGSYSEAMYPGCSSVHCMQVYCAE